MTPLSDLFKSYADKFQTAPAAEERTVLPPGEYDAVLTRGEFTQSKSGTNGYKLTFRVRGGDHDGKPFWLDPWFTDAAMEYTKRDLMKLGVHSLEELQRPLPRVRCRVRLAVRKGDGGEEYNRVATFTVTGTDDPPANPFPPKTNTPARLAEHATPPQPAPAKSARRTERKRKGAKS